MRLQETEMHLEMLISAVSVKTLWSLFIPRYVGLKEKGSSMRRKGSIWSYTSLATVKVTEI